MQFNKIACADNPGIPSEYQSEIQRFSIHPIQWTTTYPQSNNEIIANIGDAECALVSWNTIIDKDVLKACPNLKYIGMCCSLIDENSANVDIRAAREKGITVKGVRDYGDVGVIEFIISELVQLLKGLGKHKWKEDQVELGGQKLGIIGMGTTGKLMAEAALFFNMKVSYYSRNRNKEMEDKGCTYFTLEELLQQIDILSIHLPKNTNLLNDEHFQLFGNNKILVNTTLGTSFKPDAFKNWMNNKRNYAIMDGSGMGINTSEFIQFENMIGTKKTSGFTKEAKNRLAQKVIHNIETYLKTEHSELG